MKAWFKERFGKTQAAGVAAACLLTTSAAPAQDMETITRGLASAYEGLSSLSVTANYNYRHEDYFMKYRMEAGCPMLIPSPLTIGVVKYFAKGSWFGSDKRFTWGARTPECSPTVNYGSEGGIAKDEREAWDGFTWQSLDRRNPARLRLQVAHRRTGLLEAGVHHGSPLESGFRFLLAPPPGRGNEWPRKDLYLWRTTLDKMRDKALWQSLAQRLIGKVEMEERQGQACWKFSVYGGISLGGDPEKIYYKVWLPVAAPVYPIRYELRTLKDNYVLLEFEATGFLEPVDIGAGMPLRCPRKTREIHYTTDPNWLGRTVSVTTFEYTDCQFNPPISDDEFKIDSRQASQIKIVDTGRTINQKPSREGK